jgi:hypothetical protein
MDAHEGGGVEGEHRLDPDREEGHQLVELVLDGNGGFQRIGPSGEPNGHPGSGLAVVAGDLPVRLVPELHPCHVPQADGSAVCGGNQQQVLELLGGLQPALDVDRSIEPLTGNSGNVPQLAGRDLGVLCLDGGGHVGWDEVELVQLVGVEPDTQGILRPEELDLADAWESADGVLQAASHVVAEVASAKAAVLGYQGYHHQEVPRRFRDPHPLLLHLRRQHWRGQLQLVLHLQATSGSVPFSKVRVMLAEPLASLVEAM